MTIVEYSDKFDHITNIWYLSILMINPMLLYTVRVNNTIINKLIT